MSYQRTVLGGYVGKSELRFAGETEILEFSIAHDKSFQKNGEWQKKTSWFNCIKFKPSDHLKANVAGGAFVIVEGEMEMQSYNDKQGNKKVSWKLNAEKVQVIIKPNSPNSFNVGDMPDIETDAGKTDLPF